MERMDKVENYTKEKAIELLQEKAKALSLLGENRFPKRSDFSDEEVNAIKAFLGPWPRALEAAGLKEKRQDDRLKKNREKRIRAKRRRREAKKAEKQSMKMTKDNQEESL